MCVYVYLWCVCAYVCVRLPAVAFVLALEASTAHIPICKPCQITDVRVRMCVCIVYQYVFVCCAWLRTCALPAKFWVCGTEGQPWLHTG